MYQSIRPLLFKLAPETAHRCALDYLNIGHNLGLNRIFLPRPLSCPRTVMGLRFNNPVGLAAGFDKNARCIDGLADLGFGFLEVGTLTPLGQPGNPQPRLFRLPQRNAIINRMGFNNDGVDLAIEKIKQSRYRGILGISIGKNTSTPVENALADYLVAMQKVYPHADYIAINISSPGSVGLRKLEGPEYFASLLQNLKDEQRRLQEQYEKYVPLVVKVSPDFELDTIPALSAILSEQGIDGLITTNTTVARDKVQDLPHGEEKGGLSGAPLTERSLHVLKLCVEHLGDRIPIIASGGIMTPEDALARLDAGASLVQLYSGLIYRGPSLVRDTVAAIIKRYR